MHDGDMALLVTNAATFAEHYYRRCSPYDFVEFHFCVYARISRIVSPKIIKSNELFEIEWHERSVTRRR